MTDEEDVAFLKKCGWSEVDAKKEVAEYHEMPYSIREYLPLDAHLNWIFAMTPRCEYLFRGNDAD